MRSISRAIGRKWLLLLLLLGLPGLAAAQTPPAATYYVAPTGSDTAAGTSPAAPFATITHALTLCSGGQTVAVYSGTYSATTVQNGRNGVVVDSKSNRTSQVTVFGWGPTQPLLAPPSGTLYYAIFCNGANDVTYENLQMRSQNNNPLVSIAYNYANHTPSAQNISIVNCDLSDPDTADPAQTSNNPTILISYGAINITVQDCSIHDSEAGITGNSGSCTGINILNNTFTRFSGDAIQFGNWSNVLIDGNDISHISDAPGSTFHNDGIQFTGNSNNVTISDNNVSFSNGQLMIIEPNSGPINNLLIENNVFTNSSGFGFQTYGVTVEKIINNTFYNNHLGDMLIRPSTATNPTDTVIANNSIPGGIDYDGVNPPAYEDYNLLAHGTGAHDILTGAPGYVNPTAGNVHPAATSPLLHAGITSFTVGGVVVNAPPEDLDYITRGSPPTIGAYETTLGNTPIAYCGFDYSTTGTASGLTDVALDFGWATTTWDGTAKIVAPGLTYDTLPVIANAISFNSNVSTNRPIAAASMPVGYTVVGTDGVTRLGVAGTTVWLSVILEPTVDDPTGSLKAALNLTGALTGGGVKLTVGDIGTSSSWGVGSVYSGTAMVFATSAAPIATNQPAFLVVSITFVAGANNDVVKLWVNPPLGNTPPATPDATLTTYDVGPFNNVSFQGNRTATGDEVSVGTSWLSVTSGGQP